LDLFVAVELLRLLIKLGVLATGFLGVGLPCELDVESTEVPRDLLVFATGSLLVLRTKLRNEFLMVSENPCWIGSIADLGDSIMGELSATGEAHELCKGFALAGFVVVAFLLVVV
jgi:hypothetical protein